MTPKETFLQVLKPAVLRQLAGDQFDLDLNTLSAADPDLLGVKAFAAFFPGGRVRLNQAAKETDTESRLSIAGAATSQPLAGLKVRITFLPNLTMACEFDGGTDSAVLERAFPNITGAGVLAPGRVDGLAEACLEALKIDRAQVRKTAAHYSWRGCAEEFLRLLQPYPEPEKSRFWRRLRRLARLRRGPRPAKPMV